VGEAAMSHCTCRRRWYVRRSVCKIFCRTLRASVGVWENVSKNAKSCPPMFRKLITELCVPRVVVRWPQGGYSCSVEHGALFPSHLVGLHRPGWYHFDTQVFLTLDRHAPSSLEHQVLTRFACIPGKSFHRKEADGLTKNALLATS